MHTRPAARSEPTCHVHSAKACTYMYSLRGDNQRLSYVKKRSNASERAVPGYEYLQRSSPRNWWYQQFQYVNIMPTPVRFSLEIRLAVRSIPTCIRHDHTCSRQPRYTANAFECLKKKVQPVSATSRYEMEVYEDRKNGKETTCSYRQQPYCRIDRCASESADASR
jgi:hypothetical protein